MLWLKTVGVMIILLLVKPLLIQADELSIGLGGGFQTSPYRGYDDQFSALPLIHYESQYFYVRGLAAGVKLLDYNGHEVSAGLSYDFHQFRAKDSDQAFMKKLRSRHASLNADLGYSLNGQYGTAGLIINQDISGHSNGQTIDAFYNYGLDFGRLHLRPGLGLKWESEKKLKYYYGVSRAESAVSGLPAYSPKSAVTPYLSLAADFKLADSWSVTAGAKVQFLSDEIKDSPMVDDSKTVGGYLGLKYAF